MIMECKEFLTLFVFYSLVQASCCKDSTSSKRGNVGITVGTPLITLAEPQRVKIKNKEPQLAGKTANLVSNPTKESHLSLQPSTLDGFSVTGLTPNNLLNRLNWLRTNMHSETNNVSDVNNLVPPSTLASRLYSDPEGDEAKSYGFRVGNNTPSSEDHDSLIMDHVMTKQDQNTRVNLVNGSASLETLGKARNTTLQGNILKDPLTKVSYALRQQQAVEQVLPTYFGESKDSPESVEENSLTSSSPAESGSYGLPDLLSNGNEKTSGNESDYNVGVVEIQHDNEKTDSHTYAKIDKEAAPSKLPTENTAKEPNTPLSQFIKNIVHHLGSNGSKFVAAELSKHPVVKDVWATAIAHALIKQSIKLYGIDSAKNVTEILGASVSPQTPNHIVGKASKQTAAEDEPTHVIKQSIKMYGMDSAKNVTNMLKSSASSQKPSETVGTASKQEASEHEPVREIDGKRLQGSMNGNTVSLQNITVSTNESIRLRLSSMKDQLKEFDSNINQSTSTGEGIGHASNQLEGKPINRTVSSRPLNQNTEQKLVLSKGEERLANSYHLAGNEKQVFNKKPLLTSSLNRFVAVKRPINPETNLPFLFDRFTKLDPGESKYVQLNLMNDPIAKEEFTDSVGAYPNQQQQQREDEQEAMYFEQELNGARQSVGRSPESPVNKVMARENNGEAKFVAGQVLADPFTKAELTQTLAPESKIINEENRQNAQIMAAVLHDDDQRASQSYQEETQTESPTNDGPLSSPSTQQQQQLQSRYAKHVKSPPEQSSETPKHSPTELMSVGSQKLGDNFKITDEENLEASSEGKMLLSPETVSDISAIDLAPMHRLQALQGSYSVNKPKSFMHGVENDMADRVARENAMIQYEMMTNPQKKNGIHMKREENSQYHAHGHGNSSSPSATNVPTSVKTGESKQKSKSWELKRNLMVSHKRKDQLGSKDDKIEQKVTRESDISPTSVIFGLTAKEMKELESHMTRKPYGSPALDGKTAEDSNLQLPSPAAKGYYDENTETSQPNESLALFVKKILQRRRNNSKKPRNLPQKARKMADKPRHHKSASVSPKSHKRKKLKANEKRDLESWEESWHPAFDTTTNVLNSDLDQLKGLSPRAQEDISRTMLRDLEGQARHFKTVGSYPFDDGYAFERTVANNRKRKGEEQTMYGQDSSPTPSYVRRKKSFKKISQRPRSNVKLRHRLTKKSEFPMNDDVNMTSTNYSKPVLIKGNKILNGDVSLLDEVKNIDAHDELLKTLRQESEGDMFYIDTLQNHDLNRMKNLFLNAGNEVGTKRHTQARKTTEGSHGNKGKGSTRRDFISDSGERIDDNRAFMGGADALDAFQTPEIQKQLLHALRAESVDDLSYVDALQDADKQGLKVLHDRGNDIATAWDGLRSNHVTHKNSDDIRMDDYKHSQEKLREFLKHHRIKSHKFHGTYQHQKNRPGTSTRNLKDSAFRELSPEGKVLSTDYKELGAFTGDAQDELASVLRTENNGDEKDLKKLERLNDNDERAVEQLFGGTVSGPLKRSDIEKATNKREGLIETIADISDPGSKEKDISIVVRGEDNAEQPAREETKKVEEPRPSEWSSWSKCSKSCGEESVKTRSIYCEQNSSTDTDSFLKCPGWNHQTVPCNVSKQCPVNGGFTQWTMWSECSESCGPKAVRMRMRLCTDPPPAFGGKDCSGWRFQVEYCKSKECPHTQVARPTEGVKTKTQTKFQKKNNPIIFRTLSATPLIEEISSNIPTDAVERSRERTILTNNGLRHYTQEQDNEEDPQFTTGIPDEQQMSNLQHMLNVDQMRIPSMQELPDTPQMPTVSQLQQMQHPTEAVGSISAMPFLKPSMGRMSGSQEETYENGGKTIHLRGKNEGIGFTSWNMWSSCTASCGRGMRTRTRTCIGSFEAAGIDSTCLGPRVQTKGCRLKRCPVDGQFTPWSDWSECSKTCGPDSYRKRERTCTDPPPRYGGEDCEGRYVQRKHCLKAPCPQGNTTTLNIFNITKAFQKDDPPKINASSTFFGGFTEWGPWSQCSKTCGSNSLRVRKRSCFNPFPFGNQNCTGSTTEVKPCLVPPCRESFDEFLPYSQKLGLGTALDISVKNEYDWSPWSACSETCGPNSYRARERTCSMAFTDDNGKVCLGTDIQKMQCDVPMCVRAPTKMFTVVSQGNAMGQALPGFQTTSNVPAAPPALLTDAFLATQPGVPTSPALQGKAVRANAVTSTPVPPWLQAAPAAKPVPNGLAVPLASPASATPTARKAEPLAPAAEALSAPVASSVATPAKAAPSNQTALLPGTAVAAPTAKAASVAKVVPSAQASASAPVLTGNKTVPGNHIAQDEASSTTSQSKTGPGTPSSQSYPAVAAAPAVPKAKAVYGSPLPQSYPAVATAATVHQAKAVPGSPHAQSGSAASGATVPPQAKAIPPLAPLPKLPPPDPNFSDWSPWSKCSATCGQRAVMYRERACKLRGRKCQGPNIETKPCPFVRCPVNGGFSPWSQWTHCPVTCGTMALARRQRACNNPKPTLGGRDCEGERMQIKNCGRGICPVNGGLTGWTEWSTCSKSCNTNAVSIRERYCTNPPPRGRGKDCVGQRMQARACASPRCPVDGGFTPWSKWSECPRCVRGNRKRARSCTLPPPTNGGKLCVGPAVQEEKCPFIRCRTNHGFGPWSSFSRCSRLCGGGIKRRRRRCRSPRKGCYGPRVQRRRCNSHSCPNENFLIRADPVELCGFNPCKVAKCALDPSTMCVSNSKCEPIFFNTDGKIIESCRGDMVLLAGPPERVCRFDVCKNSACYTSQAERCAVSYKCKPIFFQADGGRIDCRGLLTVPAKDVCGFDPCFEKACKVDLTARCVSDAQCKPTFISKTERILEECVEDNDDDDLNDEDDEENEADDARENDEEKIEEYGRRKKHRKYDEDSGSDDEERDDYRHRKHKKKISHDDNDEETDDNDDDDSTSKKKDVTPFVNLNVTSSPERMVSGTGSEISFVSKHGPATFYWLQRGKKGSKNSKQMLVIEAKGTKKSLVHSPNTSNTTRNIR